ncbi:type I-F CRISPR-associated protein Csy3 [Pseudoalteromonas ruthenica]|nr:type I-F CRISPR-associated protein Csy3 [Pseudoalteromonas ruthenica]TMP22807.1 type I-F CRISPR-associated protein Csy3 [Pseudoalteromonas ruthenica]USN27127.1 type I-F CRISPR-associated protein Csy3/Cas7 [synthetic construct]
MRLPRHLSYTRSLSPGKAVFFYQTPESDFEPLQIEQNKLIGQKSGFTDAYQKLGEPKSLAPQDLAFGNPQTIDVCYVPPTVNEIFCRFSLRVEANSVEPYVCDDRKVSYWLKRFVETYKEHGGFKELASRYAKNILMGNWLWRNKQSPGFDVEVLTEHSEPIVIEGAQRLKWNGVWGNDEAALATLTEAIENGLANPQAYCYLDITSRIKTAFCQEIHPSQKFVDNVEQGMSSKQLAYTQVDGKQVASLNAQKVGAAIQTIDDWYTEDLKRLRIHEYGADKQVLVAHRTPKNGLDFYSLLPKVAVYIRHMERDGLEDDEESKHIHYLASILLKGGLFQRSKG